MFRVCVVMLLVTLAAGRYVENGSCNRVLDNVLRLAPGTNCRMFLQCTPQSQTEDAWMARPCAPGTLFDETIHNCNHAYKVSCHDNIESTTPINVEDECSEWSDWSPCVRGSTSRTRSCNYSDSDCPVSSVETGCCTSIASYSCEDIHRTTTPLKNGTYTIYNRKNETYEVFCLFYPDHGYTFVSSKTAVDVNIADIFTSRSEVLIRHRRIDGSQFEATIQQISRFNSEPLSVQYNSNSGYTWFHNSQMTPYLYLGLIPKSKIDKQRDTQGYKVNGQDQTFRNCDGNPNSYFVFLFNHNKVNPTSYNVDNNFMHRWVDLASQTAEKMPDHYFSFMEMHMGGCGGYTTTGIIRNINGAALGMRYDLARVV